MAQSNADLHHRDLRHNAIGSCLITATTAATVIPRCPSGSFAGHGESPKNLRELYLTVLLERSAFQVGRAEFWLWRLNLRFKEGDELIDIIRADAKRLSVHVELRESNPHRLHVVPRPGNVVKAV